MTKAGLIALRPERCDHCGRCVPACPRHLVKVTGSHLYVDPKGCDGCMACVSACSKGAIVRASAATGKTVVGSRAEAKALKKASGKQAKVAPPVTVATVAAAGGGQAEAPVIGSRARVGGETGSRTAADRPAARSAAERTADDRAMPGTTPWTLVDAGIAIAVVLVGLLANKLVLSSQAVELMPEAGRIIVRGLVLGLFATLELAALAILSHRHGKTLGEAFALSGAERSGQDRIADAILVVALLVGVRVVGLLSGAVARSLHVSVPAGEKLVQVFGSGIVGIVLSAATVVLVTPVVEELVFRGIVQKALAERFSPWYGIAGAAAVFALLHFTPWMFVPVFALGVAAGWLAWNRGTLWPAIALHALYNASAVAAAFWIAR